MARPGQGVVEVVAGRRELVVLLNAEPAGVLQQDASGRLGLSYDQEWRDRDDAYPLSLSMPLTRITHPDAVVRPFVEGLLPDNRDVLERWARQFHVSARNPFALLRHMGEDCAGAVQFIRPERLDAFLDREASEIEWLTDAGIAQRLRDMVENHGTGRTATDPGYFSLAGAQPKTALLNREDAWGVPAGRVPTTHILKPSVQRDLQGFEVNEHLCLRLAAELGLAVTDSRVQRFDDQVAIIVARYDRARVPSGRIIRIHQEDACQALSVPPWRKYEAEGGPGAVDVLNLLLEETDDPDRDVGTFIDVLAFNWAILGTDAHAKNYSLLIEPGSVRLAPLYDLVSALPYPHWIPYRKARLAMRIGREYRVHDLAARHWAAFAERCGLDNQPVLDRVSELLGLIPEAIGRVAETLHAEGLDEPVIDDLASRIGDHAGRCLDHMTTSRGRG